MGDHVLSSLASGRRFSRVLVWGESHARGLSRSTYKCGSRHCTWERTHGKRCAFYLELYACVRVVHASKAKYESGR